uniref:Coatomer subunit gamma n=1 Tax=Lygus hesperus TaxID=30085 RepID=A0A0A9WL27_LYGHE
MKKVQELGKQPKMNIMSPALKPEEIEELATRLSTLISMLKSCTKEKSLVSKTVVEHREAFRMYTSEEYKTKHELSAARMSALLSESRAALKDCNDRLSKVYNALQDAVSSSIGIKYRKEYKEACKLLQDAKQYLRMATSSSESRPASVRNIFSDQDSMASAAPEEIVQLVVRFPDLKAKDLKDLQTDSDSEIKTVDMHLEENENTEEIIAEPQIQAIGLLEKECSDKEQTEQSDERNETCVKKVDVAEN